MYAAGWGIGHGIALALADAGANLVIRCSRARLTALLLVLLAVLVKPVAAVGQPPHDASESYNYRVVASYPHDPSAFTQGLLIAGDRLFESTGGYGKSSVRIVHLHSGRTLREHRLPANRFGEGLAMAGNRLYQLTWKAGIVMVRDTVTLESVAELRYAGEGWGLAAMAEELVMSDGSAELRFLDTDFRERRRVEVKDGNTPVSGLNELEFVEGDLYANVWPTERIAILNPETGQVRGWLDLSNILPLVFRGPRTDVLNGIAYDAQAQRLFVTGKRWPRLFEIEVTRE